LLSGKELIVRNPSSIRPWQHVIEPLRGYLCLAEGLCHQPQNYIGAWNFGPSDENSIPVAALVNLLIEIWGSGSWRCRPDNEKLHESNQLRLDSTRAQTLLGWTPLLTIYEALDATGKWYREARHLAPDALYDFSCNQLLAYAH
jgi:CDP-glucose 4,6-dehydratase